MVSIHVNYKVINPINIVLIIEDRVCLISIDKSEELTN